MEDEFEEEVVYVELTDAALASIDPSCPLKFQVADEDRDTLLLKLGKDHKPVVFQGKIDNDYGWTNVFFDMDLKMRRATYLGGSNKFVRMGMECQKPVMTSWDFVSATQSAPEASEPLILDASRSAVLDKVGPVIVQTKEEEERQKQHELAIVQLKEKQKQTVKAPTPAPAPAPVPVVPSPAGPAEPPLTKKRRKKVAAKASSRTQKKQKKSTRGAMEDGGDSDSDLEFSMV